MPLLTVFTLASKARFLPVLLASGQKSYLTSASFPDKLVSTHYYFNLPTSTNFAAINLNCEKLGNYAVNCEARGIPIQQQ